MKKMNRIISLLLALVMVLTLVPVTAFAAESDEDTLNKFNETVAGADVHTPEEIAVLEENKPGSEEQVTATEQQITATEIKDSQLNLQDKLLEASGAQQDQLIENLIADDEIVSVIVVLEDRSLLDQGFTRAQIAANSTQVAARTQALEKKQETVMTSIAKTVDQFDAANGTDTELEVRYQYHVIISGMALDVPYGTLDEIRQLDGVKTAFVAPTYSVPETEETVSTMTYATRNDFGSAQTWETGYTGEGMRIAIIDTGLDLDHPSFAAAPTLTETSLTKEELKQVLPELNAYQAYQGVLGLSAETVYRSEKIPFAFNYCDSNLDATHDNDSQGDHGTHVAGIAAANRMDNTEAVGVAPDAQVIVMKVFGASGGGRFSDVLACLEDCFILNVDAVNMSLGTPVGFVSDTEQTDAIFAKILESDMLVSISAGNSYSAAYMNAWGTNLNMVGDIDNGVVSSPSTYLGATSVASIENNTVAGNYFSVGEHDVCYSDASAKPFTGLEGTYSYVVIPGYGAAADFEGLDLTGKIALISRGSINFTEKQTNAYNAGAVGCIVYDNVEEELINMQDAGLIPNVCISMADGQMMIDAAVDGEGTMVIHGLDELIYRENYYAGQMSDFSSWGVTPDLQLVPDVTAPGGNIYSTLNNGQYGNNSGTSMSAPHIAGMGALVLQYLHQEHPELSDSELHTVTEALIMSTAEPVEEPSGVLYSPRKQGAGSANVYSAISSPVYLTADNGQEQTPKISFGDDADKEGVYRFSFEMNNFSDAAQTYVLDGTVLTDQYVILHDIKWMGETSHQLDATVTFTVLGGGGHPAVYDINGDGVVDLADVQYLLDSVNGLHTLTGEQTGIFDLTGDGTLDTADVQKLYELLLAEQEEKLEVTVAPGETLTVYVTVTLSDEDKAYMDENYPNGIYVDGFVRAYAQAEDGVDLSLPFLGFYGDWSQAPVFDIGWYYEDVETLRYNRYPNVLFTDVYYLGLNPYVLDEEYDPAHNVLSPNGDNLNDVMDEIYLSLLRSAEKMTFTWSNAETGEIYFQASGENIRKSYYSTSYNLNLPMIYSSEVGQVYDLTDASGNTLPSGTKLNLTVEAFVADGENVADDTLVIPITIDTEAPTMDTASLRLWYEAATDSRKVEFQVHDNYCIAAVAVVTDAGDVLDIIDVDADAGETVTVEVDVSNYDEHFQIVVCDYGMNERAYAVEFAGERNENYDAFYGYRHMSVVPSGSYYIVSEAYNGWYSFEDPADMTAHTYAQNTSEVEIIAAEYIDGFVFGIDEQNKMFTMKMGDWNRTYIGAFKLNGLLKYYNFQALDMAFDYTTNTLYCLTDENTQYKKPAHLVTIDYLTGTVTDVGVVSFPDGAQGMALACDNDGTLYTINYDTGELYTISKTAEKIKNVNTVTATLVGATGYVPQYWQAMTVDHETDKLYWSAYQGYLGHSAFFEVDKTTGALTEISSMEHNAEISALIKPYHPETSLFPEDAALTGLTLNEDLLFMASGTTEKLRCMPLPYYAELGNVVWSSSDETVATVSGGNVTAVSAGTATITATCGDLSVSCEVTVKNFTGTLTAFNTGSAYYNDWYRTGDMSSFNGAKAMGVAEESYFFSAVEVEGTVYAYDDYGNFWALDPETMEGEILGYQVTDNVISDLAMNYADGFLYGIEYVATSYSDYFYLVKVNRMNGALERVMQMSDYVYGMTIDYDGYFYFLLQDTYYGRTYLKKAMVEWDGWYEEYYLDVWQSMNLTDDYPVGSALTSLYYSDANDGLFWTYENDLLYVNMEEEAVMELGEFIPNNTSAMMMALHGTPDNEPEPPTVAVESVTMPASFSLLCGATVSTNLDVQPWNAQANVTYTVEDPTIVSVSKSGYITGLQEGTTTISVSVEGYDEVLSATVEVLPGGSTIYGYFITDFLYSGEWWISFADYDPTNFTPITSYSYTITAADYYDGYIYAAAQAGNDWQNKIVLMKIDPDTYACEVIGKPGCNIMDMAFDYTTGTMYAIADRGGDTNALAQFNLETGGIVEIAEFSTRMVAMLSTPEGQLYTIDKDGCLNKVDKLTGEVTVIADMGSVGTSSYQSMTYDHNTGNVYWVNTSGGLFMIDLTTGVLSSLGGVGTGIMNISGIFSVSDKVPSVPAETAATGVDLQTKASIAVGETTTLKADVLPLSVAAVDKTLTWTSSDESVATVDASGTVTAVSAGTVLITATNVNGQSDTCLLTVTSEAREFYAYDRTNTQWVSFSADDTSALTVIRDDAEGESVISASAYTGEKLYSYDVEGRFYQVDPVTFQRTYLGEGFYGASANYYDSEHGKYFDFYYKVIDMSYDDATGKLYAVYELIHEENYANSLKGKWCRCYASGIAEIDPADGSFTEVYFETYKRYGNLLVVDGKAYAVDTYISGMTDVIDLNSPKPSSSTYCLVDDYWNLPGRINGISFINDTYTDTVYAIRDLADNGGESILYTVNLTDMDVTPVGIIGGGIVVNSLFIR